MDLASIPGALVRPEDIISDVRYIPVSVARERLETAGKWDALVAALSQDMPKLVKLLSLRDGLDPADQTVRAMLTQIGADPNVILAP